MKTILLALSCLIAISVATRTARASDKTDPAVLRVALVPDESPSVLIKKNEGLKAYLEKAIGKPVELIVTTDYSSMIEAMRRGKIDVGYFGPLSYVLAKQRCNITPFAVQVHEGKPTYRSVIIANAGAGVKALGDARGKTVVWGDRASTSSHLIPKSILLEQGLTAGKDYSEQFVGSHDAVAFTVQSGKAQVGGMSEPILQNMIAKGLIKPERIQVLTTSKEYPNYPWAMQSYLKPELQAKIRNAFLGMKDSQVLANLKADGFLVVTDKEYDVIRRLGDVMHLDLTKL